MRLLGVLGGSRVKVPYTTLWARSLQNKTTKRYKQNNKENDELERREERRVKRSQKNTEKIKRPSSNKSKDVLCHALLTPLSSVRREEKNEGKRK